MKIINTIERICVGKNTKERFEIIKTILIDNNINFIINQSNNKVRNIIIPSKEHSVITLTAHYDIVNNSKGYNDNTSGVVTILTMIMCLPKNVEVVFTDCEETGGRGVFAYRMFRNKHFIANVNIDSVGLKGMVYADNRGIENISKCLKDVKQGKMPFNDSQIFRGMGFPSICLSAASEDLKFQDGINTIWDSIHGNEKDDDINLIDKNSIIKVGGKALEIINEINKGI